jgi:hypothetical protein
VRFRRRVTVPLLVTLATAALIAGWWYARAVYATGTLTGSQIAIAARQSTAPFSHAISGIDWLRVADFALVSHIWLGGWSFLVLRTWMYRAVELIFVAACASLLVRSRYTRLQAAFLPRALVACLAVQLCFWAGMIYYAWATWLATGEAAVLGYYAYVLVVPEAVCLIAGLPARRFAIPAVVVCFAAMELYGTVFCLMPYYAGLTAHSLRGSVPAMQASRLLNGGMAELLRNLAVNKPDFVSAGALLALWAGFLLAIAGVIAVSLSLAFSQLDKSGSRAANGLVPLGPR